jgi:hypothetical protein
MKKRIWDCVCQFFHPRNLGFNPEWKILLFFLVEFFVCFSSVVVIAFTASIFLSLLRGSFVGCYGCVVTTVYLVGL